MTSDEPFTLARARHDTDETFVVVPAAAGGWTAVGTALTELLLRRPGGRGWRATIDLPEPAPNAAFARLGRDAAGRIRAEVAGDGQLPLGFELTGDQLAALEELGWLAPDGEGDRPNHQLSWSADQLPEACAHVLATLVEVYGFGEDDPVRVTVGPAS